MTTQLQLRKEIKDLKQKVKNLEQEIIDRTRNYLLQRSRHRNQSFVSIHTQTYFEQDGEGTISFQIGQDNENYTQKSSTRKYNKEVSEDNNTSEPSRLWMTGTPAKKNFDSVLEGLSCRTNPKEEDISNFNLDDIQVPMDLKGNLQHKHDELLKQKRSIDFGQAKQQASNIYSQQQSVISNDKESILSTPADQNSEKEIRKLKRKVQKLTKRLEYETKVNTVTKEGLLISEEENYQFRLKINKFVAQLQQSKTYSTIISRQAQQLQIQLNKLQQKLVSNTSDESDYRLNASYKQFLDILKEKTLSISNCIPVENEHAETNIFRPQNQQQILEMLQRIQSFCMQLPSWQMQKLALIEREKKLFMKFIDQVCSHETITKEDLIEQLANISQLNFYADRLSQQVYQQKGCGSGILQVSELIPQANRQIDKSRVEGKDQSKFDQPSLTNDVRFRLQAGQKGGDNGLTRVQTVECAIQQQL